MNMTINKDQETSLISANLAAVRRVIKKSADQWDRNASEITLVAVSKQQPSEKIEQALAAGQLCFGENRVQEAQDHWAARRAAYPKLRLHLIGPLQTNKVREAVALFDVIETLDRPKLAEKLAAEMTRQGRNLPCFIQVNTGQETQKSGISPADLGDFIDFAGRECGLNIRGLMCIPPVEDPPGLHFAFLRQLAGQYNLPDLSMGMSGDYKTAIAAGATYIRVGTGIFGARESS